MRRCSTYMSQQILELPKRRDGGEDVIIVLCYKKELKLSFGKEWGGERYSATEVIMINVLVNKLVRYIYDLTEKGFLKLENDVLHVKQALRELNIIYNLC